MSASVDATPDSSTSRNGVGRPPHAEFMQIWEEGHLSHHVSFRIMQVPMLFIADGVGMRGADGGIDRAKVRTYVNSVVASQPAFRLRLQRPLLGLTSPAWVPDTQFDVDRHLIIADDEVDFATAELRRLAGDEDPTFSQEHPLWRLRITPLTDGNVAIGVMMHHASLDGLSGMRLFSAMTQGNRDAALPEPADPFAGVRAARRWELPRLGLAQWWGRQDSFAQAWGGYWRKPLRRRIRRVAARTTLPLRYHAGGEEARRRGLPKRHSAYRELDAVTAGRRARELGGTLSDLQAAALIGAWEGPEQTVSLRFPVSFHSTAEAHIRNHVRDMEVYANPDQELAQTVQAIRTQIDARDDTKPYPPVPGRKLGYSTLVPWVSRPRYFCGSEIVALAPFPGSLGADALAGAGIMYGGKLFVGVNTPVEVDVEATMGRVYELMTGQPDPGRPHTVRA